MTTLHPTPHPTRCYPEPTMTPDDAPRYNSQGARLCTAHRSNGKPCRAPAMRGQNVCQAHGGSSPQARKQARLRLANLVDPAIGTLAREMVDQGNASRDKQSAANSILDRAGWGRSTNINLDDARAELTERIEQALHEQEGDK